MNKNPTSCQCQILDIMASSLSILADHIRTIPALRDPNENEQRILDLVKDLTQAFDDYRLRRRAADLWKTLPGYPTPTEQQIRNAAARYLDLITSGIAFAMDLPNKTVYPDDKKLETPPTPSQNSDDMI